MKNADLSLAATQQNFNDFYKKKLRHIYAELEPIRRQKIKTLLITLISVLIADIALIFACVSNIIPQETYSSEGFIKIMFGVIFVEGYYIYKPFVDYRTTTKNRVMNIILSFWGKFSYYHERDIIGEPTIKCSEIFGYFNKIETDDAFSGKYHNVLMDVSEHNLRIHGNKGDTNIFKGVLIMLDFPKKFKSKTVVTNKGRWLSFIFNNPLLMIPVLIMVGVLFIPMFFMYKDGLRGFGFMDLVFILTPVAAMALVFALIYIFYRYKHPHQASHKVKLEGIQFMRRWNILTGDQVEARYILTPVLMEKIQKIKCLFHGRYVDFSFFDSKLLIAVHTRKNMFETTSLPVPALSYQKVRRVIRQLHYIFAVIDILNNTTEHNSAPSGLKTKNGL